MSKDFAGEGCGLGEIGNPTTTPVGAIRLEYLFKEDPRLGANAGGTFTLSPLLLAVCAAFDTPDDGCCEAGEAGGTSGELIRIELFGCCC